MDATWIPLLIAVAGGGGALTAWITGRTQRKIEEAKVQASDNNVMMDSAFKMIATLQEENKTLREQRDAAEAKLRGRGKSG